MNREAAAGWCGMGGAGGGGACRGPSCGALEPPLPISSGPRRYLV